MGETAHEAIAGPGPSTMKKAAAAAAAAAARVTQEPPFNNESPSTLSLKSMRTTTASSRSSRETSRTPEAQQHIQQPRQHQEEYRSLSLGMPTPAFLPVQQSDNNMQYCLEVSQAPTRGRTCGFGDADRRALSAPLIARLRVYDTQSGNELSIDDIDISFLIVAADLWSADGTEEMNLVQHPASHYLKASSPAPADLYKYHTGHDNRSTYSSHGLPSHVRPDSRGLATNDTSDPRPPLMQHAPATHHSYPSRRSHSPPPRPPQSMEGQRIPPHLQQYPHGYDPPSSRSHMQSFPHSLLENDMKQRMTPYDSQTYDAAVKAEAPTFGSPPMGTFALQAPRPSPPFLTHDLPPGDHEFERLQSSSTSYLDQPSTAASTVSSLGLRPATMSRARPSTGATSLSAAAHISGESLAFSRLQGEVACVKNLIGALTTNGHKLKAPGESKSGVFFVFHDLSVRTEGSFRIRLRLVSIGDLLTGMHSGASPVLSECFTTPFEVMSAKKFPGMLDPTPLSQAFAKQGLRIPTRKGANRKRRRAEGQEDRDQDGSPNADEEDDEVFY